MARDYGKVASTFWTGETGRAIRKAGGDCQRVALYLMTCGSSNMIGLYYLPLPVLCHEVGLDPEGASKALRSLEEAGFSYWCDQEERVWIPRMAGWQIAPKLKASDNRVTAIAREWEAVAKSRFYLDFYRMYRRAFHLPEPEEPDEKPEAPSKPLRSQEQEQEQEQEHEQDHTTAASAAAGQGRRLVAPVAAKNGSAPSGYHPDFEDWYAVYPKRERKRRAFEKWKVAGKRLVTERRCTKPEAVKILLDAVREFAASDLAATQYCPNPCAWLEQGRWDDDRSTWVRRPDSRSGPAQRPFPSLCPDPQEASP